jgi:hypothetical protein
MSGGSLCLEAKVVCRVTQQRTHHFPQKRIVWGELSLGLRFKGRGLLSLSETDMKQLTKNPSALQPEANPRRRWVRNVELCRYLGVGKMTLWRWQQDDPSFPKVTVRNGIPFNDLNKIDEWMEAGEQA